MAPAGGGGSGSGGAAAASQLFDEFCAANTYQGIVASFTQLCDALGVWPAGGGVFYERLKARLTTWRAQSLWARLDRRSAHREYRDGTACSNTRVLIVGAGPCGLRMAIEVAFLGGRAVIVEKRDRFSRNNVLHLWPYLISDLKALGAKKFFGKFCAGSINHVSIRTLQCILLKTALLVGVEVHTGVSYEDLLPPAPPSENDTTERVGWRAKVSPAEHPVNEFEFDVLIGADGRRNTLAGFRKKEFRGKLAIAITANFINRHSREDARVEEISGVAFIFNQRFFRELNASTGVDLENIVYYKNETHYFVMTAKKHSLLAKGVIKQDFDDPEKLLARCNVDQDALKAYAVEAADVSTDHLLPQLEFAHNHYGQADVAMFDFTSMYHAEHACRVVERAGRKLLVALIGDSLLEPFWPMGTGCARGFMGVLDTAWLVRAWASGRCTPLDAMAERESVYQLLSQTTPDNTLKNFALYTIDPSTRYVNVNPHTLKPFQMKHQYDGQDGEYLSRIVEISEKNSKRYDWLRDSHYLFKWFQRALQPYRSLVKLTELTDSWRSGLAYCALIHRYRPHLIDVYALNPVNVAMNNQLAFDIAAKELGISPPFTGEDILRWETPDKLSVVSYLSQFYELFRAEDIRPKKRSHTPETTAARLERLSKINRRIRQRKEYLGDGDKENTPRRVAPVTSGVTQQRIRQLNSDGVSGVGCGDRRAPPHRDPMLRGLEAGGGSQVGALAKDLVNKLCGGGETGAGVGGEGGGPAAPVGRSVVGALAKDLAHKLRAAPAARSPDAPRARPAPGALVGAIAGDLAVRMRGGVDAGKAQQKGKAKPADLCNFCHTKVYLVERCTAESVYFHRRCFQCDYCGTSLTLGAYACTRLSSGTVRFVCSQHDGTKSLRRAKKRSYHDNAVQVPSRQSLSAVDGAVNSLSTRLNRTPERIEYDIESEQEESELDQTTHNLSASMSSLDSDSESESDSSGEDWPDVGGDLSDGQLSLADLADTYRRRLRQSRRRRQVAADDDDGGSDTETETIGSSDGVGWRSDSETEKEVSDNEDRPRRRKKAARPTAMTSSRRQLAAPARAADAKPSPTSNAIMRNKMAFFSTVTQPVRIDAMAFFGLSPQPLSLGVAVEGAGGARGRWPEGGGGRPVSLAVGGGRTGDVLTARTPTRQQPTAVSVSTDDEDSTEEEREEEEERSEDEERMEEGEMEDAAARRKHLLNHVDLVQLASSGSGGAAESWENAGESIGDDRWGTPLRDAEPTRKREEEEETVPGQLAAEKDARVEEVRSREEVRSGEKAGCREPPAVYDPVGPLGVDVVDGSRRGDAPRPPDDDGPQTEPEPRPERDATPSAGSDSESPMELSNTGIERLAAGEEEETLSDSQLSEGEVVIAPCVSPVSEEEEVEREEMTSLDSEDIVIAPYVSPVGACEEEERREEVTSPDSEDVIAPYVSPVGEEEERREEMTSLDSEVLVIAPYVSPVSACEEEERREEMTSLDNEVRSPDVTEFLDARMETEDEPVDDAAMTEAERSSPSIVCEEDGDRSEVTAEDVADVKVAGDEASVAADSRDDEFTSDLSALVADVTASEVDLGQLAADNERYLPADDSVIQSPLDEDESADISAGGAVDEAEDLAGGRQESPLGLSPPGVSPTGPCRPGLSPTEVSPTGVSPPGLSAQEELAESPAEAPSADESGIFTDGVDLSESVDLTQLASDNVGFLSADDSVFIERVGETDVDRTEDAVKIGAEDRVEEKDRTPEERRRKSLLDFVKEISDGRREDEGTRDARRRNSLVDFVEEISDCRRDEVRRESAEEDSTGTDGQPEDEGETRTGLLPCVDVSDSVTAEGSPVRDEDPHQMSMSAVADVDVSGTDGSLSELVEENAGFLSVDDSLLLSADDDVQTARVDAAVKLVEEAEAVEKSLGVDGVARAMVTGTLSPAGSREEMVTETVSAEETRAASLCQAGSREEMVTETVSGEETRVASLGQAGSREEMVTETVSGEETRAASLSPAGSNEEMVTETVSGEETRAASLSPAGSMEEMVRETVTREETVAASLSQAGSREEMVTETVSGEETRVASLSQAGSREEMVTETVSGEETVAASLSQAGSREEMVTETVSGEETRAASLSQPGIMEEMVTDTVAASLSSAGRKEKMVTKTGVASLCPAGDRDEGMHKKRMSRELEVDAIRRIDDMLTNLSSSYEERATSPEDDDEEEDAVAVALSLDSIDFSLSVSEKFVNTTDRGRRLKRTPVAGPGPNASADVRSPEAEVCESPTRAVAPAPAAVESSLTCEAVARLSAEASLAAGLADVSPIQRPSGGDSSAGDSFYTPRSSESPAGSAALRERPGARLLSLSSASSEPRLSQADAQAHQDRASPQVDTCSAPSPLSSPSRSIVDAKRRFFYDTSQALRIDHSSVLADMPRRTPPPPGLGPAAARSSTPKMGVAATVAARETAMEIAAAAAAAADSDVFYTPATSRKPRPTSAAERTGYEDVKQRLLTSPVDASGSVDATAPVVSFADASGGVRRASSLKDLPTTAAAAAPAVPAGKNKKRRPLSAKVTPARKADSRADSRADAGRKGGGKKGKAKEETENGGKKRRSLLSLLMPSRSVDKKEKSRDAAKSGQRPARTASEDAAVNGETGPKTTAKDTKGSGVAAAVQEGRSLYEQMSPMREKLEREQRKQEERKERMKTVAPRPPKAPHTALLAPKATMEEFDTESEMGDDKSMISFQSQDDAEDCDRRARHAARAAQRAWRHQQQQRLHVAQQIQRQLAEVEMRQRAVEARGIRAEQALRSDEPGREQTELMQEWFNIVHEKNVLVRYESELMVHARELELEDRHSRLEQQYRDRMLIDDAEKTVQMRVEEEEMLQEMLEVVEQRDALVSMLDDDRRLEHEQDIDLQETMLLRGFDLSPVRTPSQSPNAKPTPRQTATQATR